MLKRIGRDEVRLGMFIERLEGNWLDHPFWRKRFILTEAADLAKLRASDVTGVVIDESLGAPLTPRPAGDLARAAPVRRARPLPAAEPGEVTLARKALRQCGKAVRDIFEDIRMGRPMKRDQAENVAGEITRLLDRSPAALHSLTRLRSLDNYTYLHSIAVGALMIQFARHLELPEEEVQVLGIASLLHDIGKVAVPSSVLMKPSGLTPRELDLLRQHPAKGHEMLEAQGETSAVVIDICRHHHERMDGTGYPDGLGAEELSLHARMAAICDVYDAVTSVRPYKTAWTPLHSLAQMANWKGHFDGELLERFAVSIGYGGQIETALKANQDRARTRFAENGYSDPSA
ncbi:HD-GYP domain-containing protein [Aureimonas psammosilenae]|uniref:HD-GYP domain-containing protein n=1 Tax=Aureimonas psammosilenae TaxID=2495496 RepID=UPI001260498A|nr:HD-GYP domain-containing protein [Aureimonas psammosilenae]